MDRERQADMGRESERQRKTVRERETQRERGGGDMQREQTWRDSTDTEIDR